MVKSVLRMADWRGIVGGTYDGCKAQGQTQEQLAFEAGLDLTCIGGIERGRRNPSLLAMVRIATALKVELVELLMLPLPDSEV